MQIPSHARVHIGQSNPMAAALPLWGAIPQPPAPVCHEAVTAAGTNATCSVYLPHTRERRFGEYSSLDQGKC